MNKNKYITFCRNHKSLPLFMEPWWLDTICGPKNWDAVIYESGGNIYGVFPYHIDSNKYLKIFKNPKLTPRLGPLINYPKNQKYSKKLAFEKKIITELIKLLPNYDFLKIGVPYNQKNNLPFIWNGFTESVSYSYIIEPYVDANDVYKNFSTEIRREISRAEEKLTIIESEDIELVYQLNSMSFSRQNLKPPYTQNQLKKLDSVLKERRRRKILYALDAENNIHSSIYLVWDENSIYYLIGGGNPNYRKSGANSLLLWQAIKDNAGSGLTFDFEGSTIEPIERYFRDFGSKQINYSIVSHTKTKKAELLLFLKKALKRNEKST